MEQPNSRKKIISTAYRLFNSGGINTTGIDRIIEESGVAKKTFYNHFPSKNKLIAEYFQLRDHEWLQRLERFSARPADPTEKVLALFDALKEWFKEPDFAGCPFIRGLAEFGAESTDPELTNCLNEHFEKTSKLVEALLRRARPKNYRKLVPQILSLMSGATVLAHATRDPGSAEINKKMARQLLS